MKDLKAKSPEQKNFSSEMSKLFNSPEEMLSVLTSSGEKQENLIDETRAEVIKMLFNKDKLLMISRISTDFMYYLTKLLIIRGFFFNYWVNVTVKTEIKQIKTPPYYTIKQIVNTKNAYKQAITSLDILIEEMLQLTISHNGLGRIEGKEIAESMAHAQREEELKRAGLFGGLDLRNKLGGRTP